MGLQQGNDLPPLVFYRAVALHSDVHREGENVLRRTTLLVKGGLVPRPSRVSTNHLSERSRIISTEHSRNVLRNGREKSGTEPLPSHDESPQWYMTPTCKVGGRKKNCEVHACLVGGQATVKWQ